MGDIFGASITGAVTLAVAIFGAGVAIFNTWRGNKHNKAIEHLKADLSHGQIVRKAQWDAEFSAYQGIWKAIVEVRDRVGQLATYEDYLLKLNIAAEIGEAAKNVGIIDRGKALDEALSKLAREVQNSAPFYPGQIRRKGVVVINSFRSLSTEVAAVLIAQKKGEPLSEDQMIPWRAARNKEIEAGLTEIEEINDAIKERLASVQVIKSGE